MRDEKGTSKDVMCIYRSCLDTFKVSEGVRMDKETMNQQVRGSWQMTTEGRRFRVAFLTEGGFSYANESIIDLEVAEAS